MQFRNFLILAGAISLMGACKEPEPRNEIRVFHEVPCGADRSHQGFSHMSNWAGSSYFISSGFYNLQEAKALAARHQAHLVTIGSAAENQVVQALLDSAGVSYALIGFQDEQSEGHHRWLNGEPIFYTNWQRLEPNNTAYTNCHDNETLICEEDAVTIAGQSHPEAGGWNDVPVSLRYNVVLEQICDPVDLR
ncbi:MAG: hypothetical protein NXI09_00575 [Bacteroidetes bacterium]|nr:hypothetical protein [Bacteroidota bacterium]